MKTPRCFTSNRFVSHLRMAGVVTLMSAAAAMAFVAVKPSSQLFSANNKDSINKIQQARAQFLRNKLALPGPEREGGPAAAAEQAYAIRAAGGAYVPFELTRNAQKAWSHL